MTDVRNSFSIEDILYDCCFTRSRFRLKTYFKEHRNLVADAAGLLGRMTLISMFVAGILGIVEEDNAVRCGNGSYQTPTMSIQFLIVAGVMLLFELFSKCLENKSLPLPRLVGLLFYSVGAVVLFKYLPNYSDSACFDNGYRIYEPFTGNHPVASAMDKAPRRRIHHVERECISYKNHCAIKFLRKELSAMVFGCGSTWVLSFFVLVGYTLQTFRTQPETIQSQTITSGPVTGGISSRIVQLQSRESADQTSTPSNVPLIARSKVNVATATSPQPVRTKISHLPELQSPVDSSTSSSSAFEGLPGKYEMRSVVVFNPLTRQCLACKEIQPKVQLQESLSLTSYSGETSSGEKVSTVSDEISKRPLLRRALSKHYPKFCRNCGARFEYLE